jgi:hypothetical protein
MSETQVRVAETRIHRFKGQYPEVPTYEHVDIALLTEGDDKPFYITLPIAEIGRIGDSGLEYDRGLVESIAEQMQQGAGGIRGHLADEELPTAFPVDAVYWVGHKMEGNELWAKGYLPPGETRDDTRRKVAQKRMIGTSIYGAAVREMAKGTSTAPAGRMTWKAKRFVLDQIDLAPANRASLRNQRGVVITSEMFSKQEGSAMPDEIRLEDIPTTIREQIARQALETAEVNTKLTRVREMETELAELRPLAEMAKYKSIVAEIRSTVGDDADMVQVLTSYHAQMTKLAEMMGVPYSNIIVRVEEMHEQVAEMKRKEFVGGVDARISEMTPWHPTTEEAKKQVAAFRASFRRAVLSQVGDKAEDQTPEKVSEIAQSLWDAEFGLLAPALVREMAGPPAVIPNKPNPTGKTDTIDRTEEGIKKVKDEWGIPSIR